MSQWQWTVNSGHPEQDRNMIETYRQQSAAQGMSLDVQPAPGGGFVLTAVAATPQQGSMNQPQGGYAPQQQGFAVPQQGFAVPQQQGFAVPQQQPGFNAPPAAQAWQPAPAAVAALPAVGMMGGAAAEPAVPALSSDRVRYLRKVYGLLTAAAFIAIIVGYATLELSPTVKLKAPTGQMVNVPILVSLLLKSPALHGVLFAVLFVGTFVASWLSKIRVINVMALFAVAALMGLEMAPMIFVAQFYAGLSKTISSAPVRDAFIMVGAVFTGITAYVFIARKDFSYLGAALSMGFFVVFGASIIAIFLQSEVFSLAVASVGALLAAGFLLFQTSYIFRNSELDDPVDDALALLVQLRNLFMFLLRIFMSRD